MISMENNKNVLAVGAVTLIIGLAIGYLIGNERVVATTSMDEQMNMHGAMNAMNTGISGKTGDALDKAFLDNMIVHHEGAVDMAQTLLAGTKRPELTKLGNDIIAAQTKEIQMMKDWRKAWFNQ